MPLTTAQIQTAYVTFFNRPADVAGLAYWSTYTGSNIDLYNTFAQSSEYTSLFAGQNTTATINTIYTNLLGRAPDVTGLAYWVNQMDRGLLSIGTIANAIRAGAQGSDATTIANKTTAATTFTTALDTTAEITGYASPSATSLAAVKAWLAAVTTDATLTTQTAAAAVTSITTTVANGAANNGSTFTLTTGVDTLTGTANNDTFIADNSNAAATSIADSIAGGSGTDTLKIYSKAATANVLPGTMSSVENIYVQGDNQGLDVSAVADVLALELDGFTAAGKTYTVNGQSVTLSNMATGVATTIAGNTSTAQTLVLSKFGTTASAVVDLSGTKAAAVTLTSSGSVGTGSNQVTLSDTGLKVATVTVTGSSALTAQIGSGAAAADFVSTGITSIDASAATAATTLTVTGTNTAGRGNLATTFAYKGGTANDVLDIAAGGFVAGAAITAAQLKLMTIDGGTGTDTLIINNTIATGSTSLTNLTSIETIGVAAANGTINMANFNGAAGVLLQGTNGGAVTVNGLASAGTLAQGTSIDGAAALNVNATGSGTADTLAWSVGSATAALGANTGAVSISGYETITLTSQGAANTLGAGGIVLAASAGGAEALSIVATKDLSLAGVLTLSGSTTTTAISGAGAVVVTGVITSGTLTNTGTGAFTATAANKVLNFDASTNTAAVSFTDSAATSAAILKGGDGGVTFVASAFADTITVGSGTNAVTGGQGADAITINHGTANKVTNLTLAAATDTAVATGYAASTAVPTAAFSTVGMDVVTGFKAGDTITMTGVTAAGTLLTNASTTGANTAGDVILTKGTYSSSGNTFTASLTGTDSAFVYDTNGTTAGGTTYAAIILVGYVDAGTADTVAAGPAAVFTANA